MRKRRLLLIPLMLLLAAVAVLPAVAGWLAEQQTTRGLEAMSDGRPDVTLLSSEVRRGWLGSTSRYRLRLEPAWLAETWPQAAGSGIELLVDSEYRHGPRRGEHGFALADVVSTFHLAGEDGTELPLPGGARTHMALFGGGSTLVTLDALAWDPAAGYGGLDFEGGTLRLAVDPLLRTVSLDAEVQRLRVRSAEGELDVVGLLLQADQQRSGGVWLGDVRAELGRMHLWTRQQPRDQTEVHGLRLTTRVDNGNGSANGGADGDLIEANGEVYLESLRLRGQQGREMELVLRGSRLKPRALARLQDYVLGRLRGVEDGELGAVLTALLEPGPVLAVERLAGELPMGTTEAAIELNVPPEAAGNGSTQPRDLAQLLLMSDGFAELVLPRQLVDMARGDQRTSGVTGLLLGMGILVPDGSHFRMDARYQQGRLIINSVPVPIPLELVLEGLLDSWLSSR